MNKKELIVLLHNDLDAFGCMLNIDFRFPDTPKKYFFTNYGNLDKVVQNIEDYIQEHNNQNLLIADVSFATNKSQLVKLDSLFSGANCTKILIDHHMYPEGFFDEFKDIKVIWDTSKSATLLCLEHLKNSGKNSNLDKLSYIIDVYDIWRTVNKFFEFAQGLNEYFWTYDMEVLAEKVKNSGYNLPEDFSETVKTINQKIQSDILDYKKRNLVYRINDITICFVPNWFNQINIQEMKEHQNIVIGISSFGIVKFRINKVAPYSREQKIRFRELLAGEANTGHDDAFTYKIKGSDSNQSTFEDLMNETKRIIDVLSSIINQN